MQKTGLKTFVYSFILSLFMIFTINGVFWHADPSKNLEIKIPNKNIMLFINDSQAIPSAHSAPVKKIALSVVKDLEEKLPISQEIEAEPQKKPKIIMADISSDDMGLIEIPLEFAPAIEETKPRRHKTAKKLDLTPPKVEKIEKTSAPPVVKIANTDNSIPLEASKKAPTLPKSDEVIRVSNPVEKEPQKDYLLPKPNKDYKLASLESKEPTPLIPLQHSGEQVLADNRPMKIVNSVAEDQVALADASVPIKSMVSDKPKIDDKKTKAKDEKWRSMSDRNEGDNPWVVAKGKNSPQNNMMRHEEYFSKDIEDVKKALKQPEAMQNDNEIQVASDTIKNLLIPIPDDILNDENLTPQLVSSKKPEEVKKEAEIDEKIKSGSKSESSNESKKTDSFVMRKIEEPLVEKPQTNMPVISEEEKNKKSILNSLSSIFTSSTNVKQAETANTDPKGLIDGIKGKFKSKKSRNKIVPTEMRLSFQPSRAEISGQTLRWIQAFATKVSEDSTMMIEIRIDGTSAMELQQKRLNLLHNILTNRGVEYSKINTVFTNREPNSFIIRTIKINNTNTGAGGNSKKAKDGYYMQW